MTWSAQVLLAGMVSVLVAAAGQAQCAGGLLSAPWNVRGAVIPLYVGREAQPSVVVRAERIYTDYQRKGFFRIGVLPIAVMEDVAIEVRQPESLTNGLARLHHWLGSWDANRLEVRRAALFVAGTVTNRLEAGRIRVRSGGTWELLDGICYRSGTIEKRAARGVLQVTGERTGQLRMAAEPALVINALAGTEAGAQPPGKPTHEN